jgi:hypothetical protein
MQRHSPLIFAITIFTVSLFPTILFGARALKSTPGDEPPAAARDENKEDDAQSHKWSRLADENTPLALRRFWEDPYLYPFGVNSIAHVKEREVVYRFNNKFFTYCRQTKQVRLADPLAIPNCVGHHYEPAIPQTHLSIADSTEKYIFYITGLDGSQIILSSNRCDKQSMAVALSPDRKLLAYRFFKYDGNGKPLRSIVSILDTSTRQEIHQFPYVIGYLTFLSNSLLHTSYHIYDAHNNTLREDRDSCQGKVNLGDDRYAGIIFHNDDGKLMKEIVFKKTINGSFKEDTTLQTIYAPNIHDVIFTAPDKMFLHNSRHGRFFRGTPKGTKLDFTCAGQIQFPSHDEDADKYAIVSALSEESVFVMHEQGVREITPEDLTPLTEEEAVGHFDLTDLVPKMKVVHV